MHNFQPIPNKNEQPNTTLHCSDENVRTFPHRCRGPPRPAEVHMAPKAFLPPRRGQASRAGSGAWQRFRQRFLYRNALQTTAASYRRVGATGARCGCWPSLMALFAQHNPSTTQSGTLDINYILTYASEKLIQIIKNIKIWCPNTRE